MSAPVLSDGRPAPTAPSAGEKRGSDESLLEEVAKNHLACGRSIEVVRRVVTGVWTMVSSMPAIWPI
jgi:hypothetical protein